MGYRERHGHAVNLVQDSGEPMDTMQLLALSSAAGVGGLGGACVAWQLAHRRIDKHISGIVTALEVGSQPPAPSSPALARLQQAHLQRWQGLQAMHGELVEQNRQLSADLLAAMRHADGAVRAKERFLASSNHDLRQPLQALELELGLASLRRSMSPQQVDALDKMHASVRAMTEILDGVLLLSQLDTHGLEASPSNCTLQVLFAELHAAHADKAATAGISLLCHAGKHAVHADAGLLGGLLGRLIDNAINASARNGGRVLVLARQRGNSIRIEVRDNGVGVAPIHQPRLFDEFYQVGNPERDQRKGLGLGLAITSRLATILGTRVELRSRLNEGSCFWLDLPRAQAAHARPCVLLLGNAGSNMVETEGLLHGWGYRTEQAHEEHQHPAGAIPSRRDLPAHAIMLWTERANDPVWRLLEGLGREHPQAIRVVMTGGASQDLLESARAHGAHLLLAPSSPAKLRALLGQHVHHPVTSAA